MLLAREFVVYISRQLVQRLIPGILETPNPGAVAERIGAVIEDELAVEDRLNAEVRQLMKAYEKDIEHGHVDYQKMFTMIKNKLVRDRGIIL